MENLNLTVYFKNGSTLEITQGNANTLLTNIEKGCGQFQMFSSKDNLVLLVNIQEIVYIK